MHAYRHESRMDRWMDGWLVGWMHVCFNSSVYNIYICYLRGDVLRFCNSWKLTGPAGASLHTLHILLPVDASAVCMLSSEQAASKQQVSPLCIEVSFIARAVVSQCQGQDAVLRRRNERRDGEDPRGTGKERDRDTFSQRKSRRRAGRGRGRQRDGSWEINKAFDKTSCF